MMWKFKRFALIVLLVSGGIFLIWRLLLSYDISRALTRIRTDGLPTTHEELNAWHAEVPDNENAALVMDMAFALLRDFQDSRSNEIRRLKIPFRAESVDPEQKRLLADYVALNNNAISKATEASKL